MARIRKEYPRVNDGQGTGDSTDLGEGRKRALNDAGGTIRNPDRAPDRDTMGSPKTDYRKGYPR